MTISQLIRSASASASPPPQTDDTMAAFPFLDLPPEIRVMIYRGLLVGDLELKQIDTAILRASKQLKTEGEYVLYGENEVWGDLMVIDDDTVFRTHVPGIFDLWGGIEPGRTTLIDHKTINERRPLGAVMKVFPTIYAKFRQFRFNLWIEDCESERQLEEMHFHTYMLAAVVAQTRARFVTVRLEDLANKRKPIDGLEPLAAIKAEVTFKTISDEHVARVKAQAQASRLQAAISKNVVAEWYNTDVEATAFLNKIGPERLPNVKSKVDELRKQVHNDKMTDQEL